MEILQGAPHAGSRFDGFCGGVASQLRVAPVEWGAPKAPDAPHKENTP